jgi:hypothetical protein
MERKRWADAADLKRCIFRARRRTTWWEFSARLFLRRPCSWPLSQKRRGEQIGTARSPPSVHSLEAYVGFPVLAKGDP